MTEINYFIHFSAIADEGSQIGEGTKIWHFCHLMPKSVVGKNCQLGQNVFIDNNVEVGNGVKIQNNVSVYDGVLIEDDAFIGPSAVFTNVINHRSFINRRGEFKTTKVGKGSTIGANATIVCGVEIGQYAFIGAGTVVTKNVNDFALIIGNPGKQVGWVCIGGIKLIFNHENIAEGMGGEKYKLINNKLTIIEQ
ncbi:MAG: acyltransferase [Ferruginibacter sp.]